LVMLEVCEKCGEKLIDCPVHSKACFYCDCLECNMRDCPVHEEIDYEIEMSFYPQEPDFVDYTPDYEI